MIILPHSIDSLVIPSGESSEVMRGWMEDVNRYIRNNDLKLTQTSVSMTTVGSMFLRVSAGVTITLSSSPDDGEHVQVQSDGAFTVTVSGPINGGSSATITTAYGLLDLRYVDGLSEWIAK